MKHVYKVLAYGQCLAVSNDLGTTGKMGKLAVELTDLAAL
jgi:hypothetical protein